MNILVINCGSSSLKYQLIDMTNEDVLCKGLVERIGIEGSVLTHKINVEKFVVEEEMKDHKKALELVLEQLLHKDHGAIKSLDEISAVGHRVVHGGEKFNDSVVVNDEVLSEIRACIELAPLHNPANIMGIEAIQELMKETPNVVVFDTAFHQTMPMENYLYALPYEYYEKYAVRRYGFHGTSHNFVSKRAAEILGKKREDLRIITCHLGNGSSMAAIDHGKVIDTSMGLTPLEGVCMGTRSGDIDPAIIPFIMDKENLNAQEISDMLNKKSGVLAISGVSSDFRDIEAEAEKGNKRAKVALDQFANRVRKYIGAYVTQMGGVDVIVFTAGVGENSIEMREDIMSKLEFLGTKIDKEKNNVRGKEAIISTDDSKVVAITVPTNEELMIARDTLRLTTK
ncbi:acetate kinase [uncultured Ezakiella sp.]|uniref:acetate/propionate family kinase n=1 Tax=uncultured Ezakiella sp. TaxID=1637529 RepID=UPI0025FDCF25|nr:acetate kinase [uncultured Ezakiella sp.]